ncbi:transglycosylase SLT domain-containing protein [Fibrella forsythiae]|uniref:Transglycosylase SLT domain-containing protein n=1 Tax=Fibrella forsythiae TaxID=2817061 RepID=A0ABS3JAH2_9BACT|nr:transglycosylase SLT domain-containing protein [Fibrella forsythiae]MBO0947001.1 transglycosylase SLT domain-containing protein [Fibrella forsythiae]
MLLESQIPAAERTAFVSKMKTVATALAIDPDWLMATMWVESRLKPTAKNPGSSASGLIQFMASTALKLGTTTGALRSMSRVQQLDYVLKYLKPYRGRMTSAFDVYIAVHYPAQLGKPLSEVWYSKTGSTAASRQAYAGNSQIDTTYGNGDGTVSGLDVQAFYYAQLKGVLSAPTTQPATPETKVIPEAPLVGPIDFDPIPYGQPGVPWLPLSLLAAGLVILVILLKKPSLLLPIPA